MAVLFALLLFSARASLQQGIEAVRQAQADVATADQRPPRLTWQRATSHVRQAQADFQTAGDRLRLPGPLLLRLGWAPIIGEQLADAPLVTSLAIQTTTGALNLLEGLEWLAGPGTPRDEGAPLTTGSLYDQLLKGQPQLRRAALELEYARRVRHKIDRGRQPSSVAAMLHPFDATVPRLLLMAQALVQAPNLLGQSHTQTYLVAYQNSDELRATGGYLA
jgi:hypothetical protein